ncbi:MAG: hypothetical protein SF162_18195 [bacterium]|nr:hypothetical protein [bacterium]
MNAPVSAHSPRFSRWLILALVCLALVQLRTAVLAAQRIAQAVADNPPPALDLLAGALWTGAFCAAAWQVFRRARQAYPWAWALISAFGLFTLARLALFAQADYDRARLPLWGLVGLFLMLNLITAVLYGVRR